MPNQEKKKSQTLELIKKYWNIYMKKNIANAITISRILISFALLYYPTFSLNFYILYIIAGFIDMIDGFVARKMGIASEFGEKLDSISDFIFVAICLKKIIPVINFTNWMYYWIGIILLIKGINLISGFIIQRRFVPAHTIMNKITGALLFFLPLFLPVIDLKYISIIIFSIATFAAIQEGHYIRTRKYI